MPPKWGFPTQKCPAKSRFPPNGERTIFGLFHKQTGVNSRAKSMTSLESAAYFSVMKALYACGKHEAMVREEYSHGVFLEAANDEIGCMQETEMILTKLQMAWGITMEHHQVGGAAMQSAEVRPLSPTNFMRRLSLQSYIRMAELDPDVQRLM